MIVVQSGFQMFMFFYFTNFKFNIHIFELLSLNPMHGDGVVYLTMFVPGVIFMFSNFYLLDLHNNTCVCNSISTMNHIQN